MATAAELKSQIIEVYIATFNRAPDALGLSYWINDGTQNTTHLTNIKNIANAMLSSPEASATYANLSREAMVIRIYANVLNRRVDTEDSGVIYWSSGGGSSIDEASLILAIINGAKADTGSADDKLTLENKKTVGEYFAITLSLNDIDLAKSTMALVTTNSDTVQEAKHRQEAFKNSVIFLKGTSANDQMIGVSEDSYIYSYEGDDSIVTGDGKNIVVSGSGIDNIHGGTDSDTIYVQDGNDTVYAKDANDIIYGGSGDDSLHGEEGSDTIYGEEDNDYLYGENGDDFIYGGSGNDFIYGGTGNNFLYGDDGDDTIYVESGVNLINAGAGNDTVYGGIEDDIIYGGSGDDTLYGNEGIDIIDGLTGNDTIYAGKGNDIINGNDGSDSIHGSDGVDRIDGERGDDIIYGGLGADILTGGEGNDIFILASAESTLSNLDYITDFSFHTDFLQLTEQGSAFINTAETILTNISTIQEASDFANAGDGSINTVVNWFVFEDNTYIIQDLSVANTFDDSLDIIVELQGIINLSGLNQSTILFA